MSNTAGVFIRSWNFLPLASTSWYSQFFCGVRVSNLLYFLYCVYLLLLLSLCRALFPMLHVFLDWPFFIALLVFFNVDFPHVIKFRAFLMSVSYLYLGSKQIYTEYSWRCLSLKLTEVLSASPCSTLGVSSRCGFARL